MVKSNPANLPTEALINKSIAPLFKGQIRGRNHLGVAIAVITPNQVFASNKGRVNLATELPPDQSTLFEIGSISKLFTTALLASLVQERVVNLQDSVCDLLPEFSQLAPEITLLRLATHTAGLPNVSDKFYQSLFKNSQNSDKTETLDNLYSYLAQYQANYRKLGQVSYSNLGVGLLGHVLARVVGLPYEQAIVNYICNPLGMVDTRIITTNDQQQRLAQGYLANNRSVPNSNLPDLISAGTFHSTTQDLSKFLMANLDQPLTPLQQAMHFCHQTHAAALGSPNLLGIGLGWFVNQLDYGMGRAAIHWQKGSTAGYQAYMGLIKDLHLGVVVLANYGTGWQDSLWGRPSVEMIGFNILRRLAKAQERQVVVQSAVEVSPVGL